MMRQYIFKSLDNIVLIPLLPLVKHEEISNGVIYSK